MSTQQNDGKSQPSRFTVEIGGLNLSASEAGEIMNQITKVAAEGVQRHRSARSTDIRLPEDPFGQWGSFNQWGSFGQVA